MHLCMYVNVCMYVSMYVCMYVCVYVCMCVCVYVCIIIYTHIYICLYIYIPADKQIDREREVFVFVGYVHVLVMELLQILRGFPRFGC